MKRVSLSILFLALLLLSSTASARIPYENNKDKNDAKGEVDASCPAPCGGRCCDINCCRDGRGYYCCTTEEYAEFLKPKSVPHN